MIWLFIIISAIVAWSSIIWIRRLHKTDEMEEQYNYQVDLLISTDHAADEEIESFEDEEYDCPIHGKQDSSDCPRCY